MDVTGGLIQTASGRGSGFGIPRTKRSGMTGPGGLKDAPAPVEHALGSMMDVVRAEHRDPAMAMLGVVPREERSAEGAGGGDVVEAPGEAGMVFQGLELRLGERVVVGHRGRLSERVTPRSASSCAETLSIPFAFSSNGDGFY